MPIDLRGYTIIDVVRKNCGSPATSYEFSKFNGNGSSCDALALFNLGSNNAFVCFSGTPGVGSTMMMVPPGGGRHLDFKCGSVQVLTSGGAVNTEFEVIGLGI